MLQASSSFMSSDMKMLVLERAVLGSSNMTKLMLKVSDLQTIIISDTTWLPTEQ